MEDAFMNEKQEWKFLFTIDEAIDKVLKMLDSGVVEISRFSKSGFKPKMQNKSFANIKHVINQKGCYAFIRGTESTMSLDHQPSDWYNDVPFWVGEVSLDTIIIDAKTGFKQSLSTKLIDLKNDLSSYQSKYNEWRTDIVDWGIFLDENTIINNVIKYNEIQKWKSMSIF